MQDFPAFNGGERPKVFQAQAGTQVEPLMFCKLAGYLPNTLGKNDGVIRIPSIYFLAYYGKAVLFHFFYFSFSFFSLVIFRFI